MWKLLILSLLFVVAAAGPTKPPGTSVVTDGYTLYAREHTLYSHKIVQKDMTWEEAQKYCIADGGSLTGFDSFDETEFVFNMTLQAPVSKYGYYIGGKRRTECTDGVNPNPLDKCGRPNIFQWVNNVASNPITHNMWAAVKGDNKTNPDNANGTGGQNCLGLRPNNPDWMDKSQGGYIDDIFCNGAMWFICGKQQTIG